MTSPDDVRLAVLAEREACAKLAEEVPEVDWTYGEDDAMPDIDGQRAAIAKAIRSRA